MIGSVQIYYLSHRSVSMIKMLFYAAFSSTGQYQVNTSVRAELLSKSLIVTAVPHVQASVQGSVRVGGATYATVTLTGNLVETTLPLTLGQHYGQWPLVAK